jgi:ATP-dependent RNA helicase RhlE
MTSSSETTFGMLGMHPSLLTHLTAMGFVTPTPIQAQAIPVALTGVDVLGIAQTGTGKTLAFALPMIERLAKTKGRGLVLLPTRELAVQVEETMRKVASKFGARTALLIGGVAMGPQEKLLRTNPHIIVATPGRLIDHLSQKTVKLDQIEVLVFDEADRMLDMGFAPQIERILTTVPPQRQTMLFSATMPVEIARIASKYMRQPVRIEVAPPGLTVDKIAQEIIVTEKQNKQAMLEQVLKEHAGTIIVFSRTKHGASRIARNLNAAGISAAEMHSDRSQSQRQRALDGFKRGQHRVLVATDIAARGIDVSNITVVVNFDLPDNPEDYVHRIGRTGRAGRDGLAITFVEPQQARDVQVIERLIKKTLPERAGTPVLSRGFSSSASRGGFQKRGGFSRGPRHNDRFGRRDSGVGRPSRGFASFDGRPTRTQQRSAPVAPSSSAASGGARPRRVHLDD